MIKPYVIDWKQEKYNKKKKKTVVIPYDTVTGQDAQARVGKKTSNTYKGRVLND